jgi:hypothetical protein
MAAIIVEGGASSRGGKGCTLAVSTDDRGVSARAHADIAGGNNTAVVSAEEDLEFSAAMVEAMNLILLTAPECAHMRKHLGGAAAAVATSASSQWTVGNSSVLPSQSTATVAGDKSGTSDADARSRGARLFLALYPCW